MLPALISTIGGLLGAGLGYASARKSSRENRENSLEVLEKEQSYNNWLLGNQKQLMMEDAKAAGMSPAFAQGSILGASSSSPSVSPGQSVVPDFSGIPASANLISEMLLNKPVIDSNARLNNAKAREQELLNKDKEERNKVLGIRPG